MFETAPPETLPPRPAEPELAPWSASAERPPFFKPIPEPGNSAAITSLVFALIGLLCVLISLGALFVISLPCSIAAWVTGSIGRKQVATGATRAGDGIAHAGLILGVVGVVLGVIGAVVWFLIFQSVDFDIDELRRQLEQRDR
jgi:hypothetical protein